MRYIISAILLSLIFSQAPAATLPREAGYFYLADRVKERFGQRAYLQGGRGERWRIYIWVRYTQVLNAHLNCTDLLQIYDTEIEVMIGADDNFDKAMDEASRNFNKYDLPAKWIGR